MSSANVHKLDLEGKEVILIGTAHVSRQSAEEVKQVIEEEKPDAVCVELCDARYDTIVNREKWKNTDIIKIIKEGKAMLFLINLLMSSFQKKLAKQFGIQPGQEMIQGIESAKEVGAELVLADRNIQTTLMRFWRKVGIVQKVKLLIQLVLGAISDEEVSEEELEKLKSEDMLTSALSELSTSFPELKEVLIDERDKYLAQKIKNAPGNKVVAVLGAGHVPGIKQQIYQDSNLAELTTVQPGSRKLKFIGWIIPIVILVLIASTFSMDKAAGIDQIVSWVLWNGSLSALGALLALGHPLAILTAFLAAPISSLNPLLAAGWFAGLAEAFLSKPNVEDFENLSEDIHTLKGFWKNKVTHILLVVVFANLGSVVGTLFGGADVIRMFIDTFFG